MLQISVDFNTMMTDEQGRVYINTPLLDKAITDQFQQNLTVIVYEDKDFQVEATLEFEKGRWYARPDWETRLDLDEEPSQDLTMLSDQFEGAVGEENLDDIIKVGEVVLRLYPSYDEVLPEICSAYKARGENHYEDGDYFKSTLDFSRTIELGMKDSDLYSMRGAAYGQIKFYELALKDLNQAIELNPADAEAYADRGIIYFELGEKQKAVEDLAVALKLEPDNLTFQQVQLEISD